MSASPPTVVVVGASRGLGLGLASEYAARGARVIGTVRRQQPPGALHTLAASAQGRVVVETLDTTSAKQIAALASRLAGETIDILFVNAGISLGHADTLPAASDATFLEVMRINALAPLRVIEALADRVPAGGVIAAMSSLMASVAGNQSGGMEVYRASKAALNMLLKSFAARRGQGRAVLAVSPGWVRTDMGGPEAPLDVATSVRGIVDVLATWRGRSGVAFVDYRGKDMAW